MENKLTNLQSVRNTRGNEMFLGSSGRFSKIQDENEEKTMKGKGKRENEKTVRGDITGAERELDSG